VGLDNYRCPALYRGMERLATLRSVEVALILSDANMPTVDGIDVPAELRKPHARTRILLMPGADAEPGSRCGECEFEVLAKRFIALSLPERDKRLIN